MVGGLSMVVECLWGLCKGVVVDLREGEMGKPMVESWNVAAEVLVVLVQVHMLAFARHDHLFK